MTKTRLISIDDEDIKTAKKLVRQLNKILMRRADIDVYNLYLDRPNSKLFVKRITFEE